MLIALSLPRLLVAEAVMPRRVRRAARSLPDVRTADAVERRPARR